MSDKKSKNPHKSPGKYLAQTSRKLFPGRLGFGKELGKNPEGHRSYSDHEPMTGRPSRSPTPEERPGPSGAVPIVPKVSTYPVMIKGVDNDNLSATKYSQSTLPLSSAQKPAPSPPGENTGRTRHEEPETRAALTVTKQEHGDTLDRGFGALKVILEKIPIVYANHQDSSALANKVRLLLLHLESLDTLFSTAPLNDVPELRRREKLICDIKERLGSPPERKGLQWLVDHSRAVFGSLEDIRAVILQYQDEKQRSIDTQESIQMDKADADVLKNVRCANQAEYRHGDREGCLAGTRTAILDEIELWALDPYSPSVYWLNGLAGTGKSTIAKTVAERVWANGRLGASFFCSRYHPDRSDHRLIFPTVAVQLARAYPHFRAIFVPLINSGPSAVEESPLNQLKKLILQPIRDTCIPTVIVIDALDECQGEELESKILSALEGLPPELPQVKFFVTSRPEPRIRGGFQSLTLAQSTSELRLHEVAQAQVGSDIRTFFNHHCSKIRRIRGVEGEWPTEEQLDQLCERAGGFFVYAMATVRFIQNDKNPKRKLCRLLQSLETRSEGGVELREKTTLDSLYMAILEEAFGSDDEEDDYKVRTVLGAVILAENPLPSSTIADLFGLEIEDVHSRLSSAHSLLMFKENIDGPATPFHKSFPDFVIDPKRCINPRFCIFPPQQHTEFLGSCLRLMSERLKKDMLKLPGGVTNFEIANVMKGVRQSVDPATKYACRSWFKHLTSIPAHMLDEVVPALQEFLEVKVLFWLQMLSVLAGRREALDALETISKWLDTSQGLSLATILMDVATKASNEGDHFRALLGAISAIYVDYKQPALIDFKVELLLLSMAVLDIVFATHAHDEVEQKHRDDLIRKLEAKEKQLESLCGKPGSQRLGDGIQSSGDVAEFLGDLQEATRDYLACS